MHENHVNDGIMLAQAGNCKVAIVIGSLISTDYFMILYLEILKYPLQWMPWLPADWENVCCRINSVP